MTRHKLDDLTWTKIYQCLKLIPHTYVGDEAKTRNFVNAVHWRMRTEGPWADLPEAFGKPNLIFKRFARWSDMDVWEKLHQHFIEDPDMEWLLLDSSVIRTHPCAAGAPKEHGEQQDQALGKSVGGFRTKIHAVVDALGNPLRFIGTAGQRGDAPQAIAFLTGFDFGGVMADRGYDANALLDFIAKNEATAVIPAKKNRVEPRETDWFTYKSRHLVECFFNKIKHYRAIFSRFEKYVSRYMSLLSFASALIWLK